MAIAFPLAEQMIRKAIQAIQMMDAGSPEEGLLKRYFGTDAFSRRMDIRKGFQETLKQWGK